MSIVLIKQTITFQNTTTDLFSQHDASPSHLGSNRRTSTLNHRLTNRAIPVKETQQQPLFSLVDRIQPSLQPLLDGEVIHVTAYLWLTAGMFTFTDTFCPLLVTYLFSQPLGL